MRERKRDFAGRWSPQALPLTGVAHEHLAFYQWGDIRQWFVSDVIGRFARPNPRFQKKRQFPEVTIPSRR